MTAMRCIAVQSFFWNRARAIALCVVVAFASVSSTYGQSNSSWGASPTYVTSVNVGIGTQTPAHALTIATGVLDVGTGATAYDSVGGAIEGRYITAFGDTGSYWLLSGKAWNGYLFSNPGANGSNIAIFGVAAASNSATGNLYAGYSGSSATQVFNVGTNGSGYFAGNVGIGTTGPPYKLSVKGTIGAQEVIVTDTSGWPDYVFNSGYPLRPLTEVASYIKEHHHLPEIPSEAEVKEKGVSVGDMQAKLLAKIEELTLHMIQADEKLSRAAEQNRQLQERIARLEAPRTQRSQ